MERYTLAFKTGEGQYHGFVTALRENWADLTGLLDTLHIRNFSLWNIDRLVFGYCESEEPVKAGEAERLTLDRLCRSMEAFGEWISRPGQNMRLMYEDFGVIRESKELIRHRVFVTELKDGMQEEYKRRHDVLAAARGGAVSPGPDSNFSIWNAGSYIFGYDEIDVTMEQEPTEESRQETIAWETKMLEIMEWHTDDVDWITGMHHGHIRRIGYHM